MLTKTNNFENYRMEERKRTISNINEDYIYIDTQKAGCESHVGRQGNWQEIKAENCVDQGWGHLLHEVMHSIG